MGGAQGAAHTSPRSLTPTWPSGPGLARARGPRAARPPLPRVTAGLRVRGVRRAAAAEGGPKGGDGARGGERGGRGALGCGVGRGVGTGCLGMGAVRCAAVRVAGSRRWERGAGRGACAREAGSGLSPLTLWYPHPLLFRISVPTVSFSLCPAPCRPLAS